MPCSVLKMNIRFLSSCEIEDRENVNEILFFCPLKPCMPQCAGSIPYLMQLVSSFEASVPTVHKCATLDICNTNGGVVYVNTNSIAFTVAIQDQHKNRSEDDEFTEKAQSFGRRKSRRDRKYFLLTMHKLCLVACVYTKS